MTSSNLPATVLVGSAQEALGAGKKVAALIGGQWFEMVSSIKFEQLSLDQGGVWVIEVENPKGRMLVAVDALQAVRL